MTGEQLKNGLARIAEAAPEIHVPGDVFARGRRANTRSRVLVGAAALACLALVAAITVPLLRSEPAGFADRDGGSLGGVPDAIYASSDVELDLPRSDLADLGPAVATYPAAHRVWNQVVVVTEDGDYRSTTLPGYDQMGASEVTPLLSPDGTLLAYPAEDKSTSHLAIVDLRSGDIAEVDLADGLGALLASAQWSPDSDWLSWSGQVVTSRKGSNRSFGRALAGIVRASSGTSRPLPRERAVGWDGAGVCDDGAALRFVWPHFLVTPMAGDVERERSWPRLVKAHGPCTPPVAYAQSDALSHDQLVGWIPTEQEAHAVLLTNGDEVDHLLLTTDGEVDTIGDVSSGVSGLSVATGLMTTDQPTVPAGESPWAPSWWEAHRSDLFILAAFVAAPWMLFLFIRRRLRK